MSTRQKLFLAVLTIGCLCMINEVRAELVRGGSSGGPKEAEELSFNTKFLWASPPEGDDKKVAAWIEKDIEPYRKIGISNFILSKPGRLDDTEWMEVRKHPEIGYRIALTIPELQGIAGYILCHHERWDGRGYPQGLSGEEIPYIARLISVVDAYDAMTEDRSYRKAITKEEALQELQANAGTQFDPEIVKVFIENVAKYDLNENRQTV